MRIAEQDNSAFFNSTFQITLFAGLTMLTMYTFYTVMKRKDGTVVTPPVEPVEEQLISDDEDDEEEEQGPIRTIFGTVANAGEIEPKKDK